MLNRQSLVSLMNNLWKLSIGKNQKKFFKFSPENFQKKFPKKLKKFIQKFLRKLLKNPNKITFKKYLMNFLVNIF